MPHHTAGGAAAAAAAYVPVLMVRLPASLGKAAVCSRQEPMRPLSISFLSIADLQVAPGAWVPSEQQQRHGSLLPWLMLPHALSTSAGRAAALSNPIFSLQTKERMTPRSTAAVATAATSSATATTAAARISRARGSEASGRGTRTVTATATGAAQGREAQKQQRHTQLQPASATTGGTSAAACADPSAQRHKHGQRALESASSAAMAIPAAAARAAGGKEGSLTGCKKQPLLRDVVRTLAARVGFLEQQVAAVQRDIGRGRHQMKEFVIEKVLDLEDELRVIGHRSRQEQVAAAEAAAPHTCVDRATATADGTFEFRHPRASATAAQVVAETVAAEPAAESAAEAVSAEAAAPGGLRAAANAAAQVKHGGAATSEANWENLAAAAAWGQDGTSVGWCEERTVAAASFKEAERGGNPSSARRGCAHFDAADFSFVCTEGAAAGAAEADGEGGGATCTSGSSRTRHSGKKTAAAADFDTIFFGSSPGCTFSSSSEEVTAEQPDAEAAAGTARKAATTEGKPHRPGTSFTTDQGQGTLHTEETDPQKQQATSQQRQRPQ